MRGGATSRNRRIDDTSGNSGVEPRVGLMYTNMVTKRGYSPAHFVDMISSNAARIMGLYPRKGALAKSSLSGLPTTAKEMGPPSASPGGPLSLLL